MKELLKLARKTIESKFHSTSFDLKTIPLEFKQKRGVFVTLHKHGELRGCIGYIMPIKSIYDGVKENALNAAFKDPRFKPLTENELADIDIEISILTVPKKLEYTSPVDLVKKLHPKIDGVILEKKGHSATFLPQVWEELPDHFEFLEHLTWKAGLPPHSWETAEIYVYQAEVIKEK